MMHTQTFSERIGIFIKDRSALSRLIVINTGVWIGINLIRVVAYLFQTPDSPLETLWVANIQNWLAVPAGFDLWISKPWTLFTYMFLHIDFWHLFFNMLWLYWFGKIFLEFLSNRKLVIVYILGGLFGGIVFMLAFNFFPAFENSLGHALALGASASVLGIVVATVTMVPDYTVNLMFIGPLKIKYIALITIIIDVFMLRSGNAGGHFAHLGGALAGLMYILAIRSNLFKGMPQFPWFNNFRSFRKTKFKTVHSSSRPLTDDEYNAQKAQKQKRIDGILDKIAKSGYKSLSEEEKEFLFKFSNK
jgi:membrane associated rhomboid family serine protease